MAGGIPGSMLVLENDEVMVKSQQAREAYREIVLHSSSSLNQKMDGWDLILLADQGHASPVGHSTVVTWIEIEGMHNSAFGIATHVAGTGAYLLSKSGAVKIMQSGLHKNTFCFDDFLNASNTFKLAPHFHPGIADDPAVQKVQGDGGLKIFIARACKGNPTGNGLAGTSAIFKHEPQASLKSDTLYVVG